MSKPARAHIKCDNGVCSPMARWEPSQHERTTSLGHSMELQADRTEIAPGGPSEVAEPLCAAHLRCAVHHAPLQEIAEMVSRGRRLAASQCGASLPGWQQGNPTTASSALARARRHVIHCGTAVACEVPEGVRRERGMYIVHSSSLRSATPRICK